MVASKSPAKRISAALSALDAADGPMRRLEAARRLREAAEELEAAQVEAARKAGVTWIEIGVCYGLTKQGAQQRFRPARGQADGAPKGSLAETRQAAQLPALEFGCHACPVYSLHIGVALREAFLVLPVPHQVR